jgi:hypothetical protein
MTVPTTTPGRLGRARAWITKTSLLAIAAVGLAGAFATAGAQPAAHPDDRSAYAGDCAEKQAIFVRTPGRWRCQNLYMARATLDARKQPGESRRGARINAIKAGEYITISCQVYARDKHTGERLGLYDGLPGGEFIPDKYVRTFYTGRIPGAPVCDL